MSSLIRLLIHGASGRMGRALLRLISAQEGCCVIAAVSARGDSIAEAGAVPVFGGADLNHVPAFDVAIDFSLPSGFDAVLDLCERRGVALVSGTTGLSEAQRARLDTACIPVLWAANFSLGVAVLQRLAQQAAALLPEWDCDIVEMHHAHKRDAPSGTALALAAAVAVGGGHTPHYASLRAGDIVGEHTLQFAGLGERIELTHRATNRDLFARGALRAAQALHGRAPGRYAFAELLFADV